MKRALLSLMAISLIVVGCFSFAQENNRIEYSGSDIIVYSPDGSYGIVIQDRNLGATMTGYGGKTTAATGSYGYHYQRGNNHGFEMCYTTYCTSFPGGETTSSSQVDASSYGPETANGYYSNNVFITIQDDWSNPHNDNLWGGEGDNESNGYGLTSNNPITGRQGPCPDGYHVPSAGEWNELRIVWYNNKYGTDLATGDFVFLVSNDTPIDLEFSEDLLIPFATARDYDGWSYIGFRDASLWSSSPVILEEDTEGEYIGNAFFLNLSKDSRYHIHMAFEMDRSRGYSVRCFKNERIYVDVSKTLTLNVITGENIVSTGVSFSNTEPITSGQVLNAISWFSEEVELASGYHFAWYVDDGGVETRFNLDTAVSEGTITSNLTLTGKIEPNKYTISFLDENGAEIMSGNFTYDQEATLPTNTSTKEGYTFKGWKDSQGNTYGDGATVKNLTTENGAILEFTPIREENPKPSGSSGGSSGGGGRGGSNTTNSQTDNDKANSEKSDKKSDNNSEDNGQLPDGVEVVNYNPDLPADKQTLSDGLTPEMYRAYQFAYKYGITTKPTILEADMYGPLDRISMAKMLSQYAINVLKKTPDTSIEVPVFPDVTPELNEEFGNAVTLAYQLGIMGINIDEFRPFDLVPRSEFGTALSRMLYGTSDGEYEKTDEYYTLHFEKLKAEGIMTVLDPYLEELRGYVMIMLMRAAEGN